MTQDASASARTTSLSLAGSAGLAVGFGSAIVSWVIAWILHLPAIAASASVSLPIIIIGLVLASAGLLRGCPAPDRLRAGLLGGLVAGLVNLLIVASVAVKQPESTDSMAEYANQFNDQALIIIPGAVIACVIAGGIGALLAAGGRGQATTPAHWLARFGVVTVFIYLPLIAVGGAVTGAEAGMAVPDSVTSYGAISVLFPFELMAEPRIFLEHSHRLFGTLAGLTTIVLMLSVLFSKTSRTSKALAVVLLVFVCFQGYMGAMRVSEISLPIAISHGIFGQIVFTLAGVLAATLSIAWRSLSDDPGRRAAAKRAMAVAVVTAPTMLIQLVLGASARHLSHMDPPNAGTGHARLAHAVFAFVVLVLVIIVGTLAMRVAKSGKRVPGLHRLGGAIHGVVTLQFLLGWAALGLVVTGGEHRPIPLADELAAAPPIRVGETLVTTAHQATGAVLLLLVTLAAAWIAKLASEPNSR
ncbi:MAG: COX15/CtaA family protein [Planctomycetota bacterium]